MAGTPSATSGEQLGFKQRMKKVKAAMLWQGGFYVGANRSTFGKRSHFRQPEEVKASVSERSKIRLTRADRVAVEAESIADYHLYVSWN